MNPRKTQAITFYRKKSQLNNNILVDGYCVPGEKTVKYFSITLDSRFSWAKAWNKIKPRLPSLDITRLYPLLAKNRKLKLPIKLLLYMICVRPIITYGYQVWASAAKTYINRAQIVQYKMLRIILDKKRDTPIPLLNQLANIPTIKQYIQKTLPRAYNNKHHNPLIRSIGNYRFEDIPLKMRIKLPLQSTCS